MAFAILDMLSMNLSRMLEALFDGLEYWLAARAYRRELKLKTKSRVLSRVLSNAAAERSSNSITVSTT
jgi:hypothetical protein